MAAISQFKEALLSAAAWKASKPEPLCPVGGLFVESEEEEGGAGGGSIPPLLNSYRDHRRVRTCYCHHGSGYC